MFRSKQHSGMTLIELVAVLILIAGLATYVVLKWPSGGGINLNAQARMIAAEIRFTQSLSITHGQHFYFVISGNQYGIKDSTNNYISDPVSGATQETLSSGITFGSLTNVPNNYVAFDGRGIPYSTIDTSGGSTNNTVSNALTANAQIPIQDSYGNTRTIVIYYTTGDVAVQ